MVFELVPGNFIIIWFGVEKLFKIVIVQYSFPLLQPVAAALVGAMTELLFRTV